MKYIDSDKLIAEIERLQKRAKHYEEISLTDGERSYWSGEDGALELLITFITSLQQEQPEVDLEEFDKDVAKLWGRCAAEPNDSIACLHIETFNEVARHFWNKGYNARKV